MFSETLQTRASISPSAYRRASRSLNSGLSLLTVNRQAPDWFLSPNTG